MPPETQVTPPIKRPVTTIGLLGFGAFGRLIAHHLGPLFEMVVCDPALSPEAPLPAGARAGGVAEVGRADLVVLAVPMANLAQAIDQLNPHLRPGAVVVDVVSVKVEPVRIMRDALPAFVDIVATHPLFGPQSAGDGIAGHKIAVSPVRGRSAFRIAAFLRRELGLRVYMTSPEDHDREAAVVQGVTHLIAQALVRMEPLPTRLTTASYEKLLEATDMVRDDAAGVFLAIERDNPFSAGMRQRFFTVMAEIKRELENGSGHGGRSRPAVGEAPRLRAAT